MSEAREMIDVQVVGPNALRVEHKGNDASPDEGFIVIFGPGFSERLPRAATGAQVVKSDDL